MFILQRGHSCIRLGRRDSKKKLLISPLQAKSILLPPNRVGIFWKTSPPFTEKSQALENLKIQMQQIQELAQHQELETIHELSTAGDRYTLEDLVFNFLETSDDPLQPVGLFLALENDRHFFKKKGLAYIARTAEELAQVEAKQKQVAQQKEWEAQGTQWLLDLETGLWNPQTPQSEEQQQWLEQLQSVLVYGKDSGSWKSIAPLFNLNASFNEDEENKLRRLLAQAGSPISWSRLVLLRASVKEEFSQNVLAAGETLCKTPLQQSNRTPWTSLPTWTIDSETTQDYDDAFSILDCTENHIALAIHTADLTNAILPGQPLFEEAERRIASVYTLEQVFSMLPSSLSNDYFSLKAGQDRLAMSFVFDLFTTGEKNFKGIEFSVIRVDENLTYEQADQAIVQEKSFWPTLSHCCLGLRQKRIEQGALDFARKEVKIDIGDPDNIHIMPIDRNTPANELVEELAILVNQEVGKFFYEHHCPGIYRVQGGAAMKGELKPGEPLTPQHFMIEPVRLSTVPERHTGLGCDYYIQATSPIRRFSDLVSQLQLAQFLQTQTFIFQEEQLMGWAEQIQNTQKTYAKAEREIENYWKYKYLAQHQGSIFSALLKRQLRAGKSEVEFETIQLTTQLSQLSQFDIQEKLFLKIENVDVGRRLVVISVSTQAEEKPA